MDRMHGLGPAFIDVTWGAGGRLSDLTCEMVKVAQSVYGLETCMHLTCTDMEKSKVDWALQEAYRAGCTNILALRGDPPREKEKWTATKGGFMYAKDLVRYIRERYGNHFDIGVAGYPEGCDDHDDLDLLLDHLKEKVDAGGNFIVTQMFYDVNIFLDWVQKCRARGITVPIVPGIMPIHTYAAFIRRVNWSKCRLPPAWAKVLEPVKNDDAAVREIGKGLVADMCQRILDAGIMSLHLYVWDHPFWEKKKRFFLNHSRYLWINGRYSSYTMNLAAATRMVLDELGLVPPEGTPTKQALPWRQSLGLNRREENVRPIFWRNHHKSYVIRTQDWDEFPNGRWGDSRSPAFGELDAYGIGLKGTNEQNIQVWGQPRSIRDIAQLFVRYLNKNLERLPWSESAISNEADVIRPFLLDLNRRGLLTINSQPAVAGVRSTDAVHGWGPRNGYVYQKAYLELFLPPSLIEPLIGRIDHDADVTYYAVNKDGQLRTNAASDEPNAVTWGVFSGKEIIQPTIVETISFLAWKDEAYRLGLDWARCHAAESASRLLIEEMMETWFLVNIVDNDFHRLHDIFSLFDGFEVDGIDDLYPLRSSVSEDR